MMAWSCFVDKFHLFYLFVPNKGCNDACLNVLRMGIKSNHLLCMMLMISLMCFTVESIWFIAYISLHYHCLLFLCLIYFVPNFLTSLLSNTQGTKDIYRKQKETYIRSIASHDEQGDDTQSVCKDRNIFETSLLRYYFCKKKRIS